MNNNLNNNCKMKKTITWALATMALLTVLTGCKEEDEDEISSGDVNKGAFLVQKMKDKLVEHKTYIHDVGIDMPEVAEWQWTGLK